MFRPFRLLRLFQLFQPLQLFKTIWALFCGALLVFIAYIGLPYLLVQLLSFGIVREGRRGSAKRGDEVALTFDDGPDPSSTPQILDILREHDAKATFFLLADKAEQHPELVQRLIDEGHEIGAHAVRHVHSWQRLPWDAYQDTVQSVKRLRQQTGQPVRFHRPPHGSYTLATLLGQRAAQVIGAQWTVNGNEWQPQMTPAMCLKHILFEVVAGSVVVLHDAGPYAHKTAELLPPLLEELESRGYRFQTLSHLEDATPISAQTWPRRFLISLDRFFDRVSGIRPAGEERNNMFRIARVPFPQEDQQLSTGICIRTGESALEFHVNNARFIDLGNRAAVRRARVDFAAVAEFIKRPENADIKAVFCLSAVGPLLRLLKFEDYLITDARQVKRLQLWARVLRWGYSGSEAPPQVSLSILDRQTFLEIYDRL